MEKTLPWILLISLILLLLLFDFLVLHKKNQSGSVKKSIIETIFFVSTALLFSLAIFYFYKYELVDNPNKVLPGKAMVKYLTGYLIELSLSVDNLFVIAIIFTTFKIPNEYQHKLLFLGILGAIIFRAILIGVGLVLIQQVHGMNIIFGLFLLYTAFKMLKKEIEKKENKGPNRLMKLFRFSYKLDGGKFITKQNGKTVFTALFGALFTIEFTDLLFALDSIPAILAITTDPFIAYSSNIFAIMGLRSLYFFLANMLEKFAYLKYSVFSILLFVAIKLIFENQIELPEWFSLTFIAVSLIVGIYASTLNIKQIK